MYPFPENPSLSDDPELSGHLWIQELVTGRRLRFQVAQSGLITFGTEKRTFDTHEETPLPYRRATDFVRDHLDLTALRSALDETESVTFYGVATLYEGIEYDWPGLSPFFGVDILSDKGGAYLSPDTATRAYDALGIPTLPPVEKEVQAKYTDLGGYVSGTFPESSVRDGKAAGVLVRDKSGGRGESWDRRVEDKPEKVHKDIPTEPEGLAEMYVTAERTEGAIESLKQEGDGEPTVDAVIERVIAGTVRKEYTNLYSGGDPLVSEDEFRSAVAECVQRHLS